MALAEISHTNNDEKPLKEPVPAASRSEIRPFRPKPTVRELAYGW